MWAAELFFTKKNLFSANSRFAAFIEFLRDSGQQLKENKIFGQLFATCELNVGVIDKTRENQHIKTGKALTKGTFAILCL